jgi:hypothetical protein
MNIWNDLFLHFLSAIALLCRPGGTKSLIAENLALKQQLLVLKRSRNGSPKTQTFDRLVLGFLASLIQPNRIEQISIVFKPATILKFHQVLVKRKYMDQYTRRIIGFAVHVGDPSGVDVCRMFNEIVSGKQLPKYLSSDNDPLFEFHRWKANLRVLEPLYRKTHFIL